MPKIDSEKFYESAIIMHGDTARGVNWSSKKNQELRFDAILELLPQELDSFSLGDAGCGFGDFYLYAHKKKKNFKSYLGIDSLDIMQQIAQEKTACEIIVANICQESLPTQDYYICSGALNVLTPFESYQFVQNCYKSSQYGFVFNALYGEKKSETYNYLTLQTIQQMAKSLDVKNIVYKEDYIENDITVGFFK